MIVWRRLIGVTLSLALVQCSESAPTTPSVTSVEITAASPSVRLGNTLTLTVQIRDADGGAVNTRAIVWSSSAPSIATVSSTGVVTALAAGTARIAASAFGRSGIFTVTVLPREVARVQLLPAAISLRVGTTATVQARAFDADNELLTDRPISWSSGNPAVASVSATGLVTAVAEGTTTISATSEGRSGQAAVSVTLAPVATIAVAPTVDTLPLAGTRTFTATVRDAGGAILSGRAIVWRSSIDTIATIASNGVVTAIAPGVTQLSATSEGRTGSATLVVLARLASSVTLTPATASLITGTTLTLTAQVTDASGNILVGRPIQFSSTAPDVATVSSTGVITGVAPGTARIVATSEGRTGSATITVVPIPVASVELSPTTTTLLTGQSTGFTAIARSASGGELPGRAVTWTSGAPAILTVSPQGLVAGVSPGTALVLATIDGVTGTATVSVRRPAVATVIVSPPDPILLVGDTLQLAAVPRDANNVGLTGRVITWSSSDENIAFVANTGMLFALRRGSATITATVEGIRGTIIVAVR
jgi:trimeric autotransporter adhesin